ncbi:MAG: 4Fe-4S dicluster domain-containing protein [Endozoicomonas sp.]|uniref:4Fe-4S dicluster domain-containing protein n=1 Tax=Endozoicomonas sp. TaxID=1892382 RepID=UPI003D9B68B6
MRAELVQSPSRRAFLKRFSQPAEVSLPESHYPRPPWARDNAVFLSLCTRCEQCIDACPQKVLRKSDELDPVLQGLPIQTLDYGSCDSCGRCEKACDTGALSFKEGIRVQAVALINDHCESGYGQPCSLCIESCAAGALSVQLKKKAQVDTELCTGCGECALDCHSRAISLVRKHQ